MWRWQRRQEGCVYKPRNARGGRPPPEAVTDPDGSLPGALGEITALPTPRLQPAHLPIRARINASCFQPPRLPSLVSPTRRVRVQRARRRIPRSEVSTEPARPRVVSTTHTHSPPAAILCSSTHVSFLAETSGPPETGFQRRPLLAWSLSTCHTQLPPAFRLRPCMRSRAGAWETSRRTVSSHDHTVSGSRGSQCRLAQSSPAPGCSLNHNDIHVHSQTSSWRMHTRTFMGRSVSLLLVPL